MNEQNKVNLARLVKARRIEKNLTQQQLADLTGLSLRSVQRLEKGEGVSRMYTIETVATHLDLQNDFQQLLSTPVKENDGKTVREQKISLPQKRVISISTAVLIVLLITAYTFQSPRFPETAFEMVLLITIALVVYAVILFWIWK